MSGSGGFPVEVTRGSVIHGGVRIQIVYHKYLHSHSLSLSLSLSHIFTYYLYLTSFTPSPNPSSLLLPIPVAVHASCFSRTPGGTGFCASRCFGSRRFVWSGASGGRGNATRTGGSAWWDVGGSPAMKTRTCPSLSINPSVTSPGRICIYT